MAKSTYYAVMKSINQGDKYSELKEAIKRICIDNKGRYGYRRVTLTLKSEGFKVNHKVVMRLMKQTGLTCKVRLKKYKSYKGEQMVNRYNRVFVIRQKAVPITNYRPI